MMRFCAVFPWLMVFSLGGAISCGQSPVPEKKVATPDTTKMELRIMAPTPDTIEIAYLLGKFDPSKDENFAKIADIHSRGSARGAYLQKESYAAFVKMYEAAKAEGVTLTILSATRNFDRQKEIWEGKWKGSTLVGGKNLSVTVPDPAERAKTILLYSSMPGTSRHHWGTDMDINSLENRYFDTGKGKKEYEWLQAHAHEFGFCQPYTAKGEDRPTGYEEERWHWSYMPLAKKYLAAYDQQISHNRIGGFAGAETAALLNVIEHYVKGINKSCK
ncbi:MAG: M15 family metallopeptidase [Bacteroidia bacterium]|nr:M15 family metallopeptidase [Bacteroidia bacterium]